MRIGILTIHRLYNYGTALQAFALQHYLYKKYGYDVELIDYIYPNKETQNGVSFWERSKKKLRTLRDDIFYCNRDKKKLFQKFRDKYFVCSPKQYSCYEDLQKNCPQYDIYITGSDQVWNIKTIKGNPVFYFDFLQNKQYIISFSASFAIKAIPKSYHDIIRNRLLKYSYIGVREKSGIDILKSLSLPSNIKCANTVDPTFLLSAIDYDNIAYQSCIKLDYQFILVYKLEYAFNPTPAMDVVINELQKSLGYDVVVIGKSKINTNGKVKHLYNVGPAEFLWLFKHAKYIVTSSFHGTMFSLIYRKAFISITPKRNEDDKRIQDLLESIGLSSCMITSDTSHYLYTESCIYTNDVEKKIETMINDSCTFLHEAITNNHKT